MTSVLRAPGAPPAAVTIQVANALSPHKRRRAPRKVKPRTREKPRGTSAAELEELRATLRGSPHVEDNRGIVCSEPWIEVAVSAVLRGRVAYRREFAAVYAVLLRAGVYPPRDPLADYSPDRSHQSLMVPCPECGRDCPPTAAEAVDLPGRTNGMCVDCRENQKAPRPPAEPSPEPAERVRLFKVTKVEGRWEFVLFELVGDEAARHRLRDEYRFAEDDGETSAEDDQGSSASAAMIQAAEDAHAEIVECKLPTEAEGVLQGQIQRYAEGKPTSLMQPFLE